jgi:aquaporin Z
VIEALRRHWPEYLIEAALLALFMISASTFGVLLEHGSSRVHQAIGSPFLRRGLMGIMMGTTAVALIYSPWGGRSGAHFNPSVTVTFLRLGRIQGADALFYVVSQFAGGIVGVLLATAALSPRLADPAVRFVATVPGPSGPGVAFAAETAISFVLMMVVLVISNQPGLSRYTGLFVGALLACYITFEAPISGMSMNPARTLGSALPGRIWDGLWIYFTAPLTGMLLAAQMYSFGKGVRAVHCAKLHHPAEAPCIFRCNYKALESAGS